MERNSAAARHSWARQHAWLLLNFLPFPVGQTIYAHCTLSSRSFCLLSLTLTRRVPQDEVHPAAVDLKRGLRLVEARRDVLLQEKQREKQIRLSLEKTSVLTAKSFGHRGGKFWEGRASVLQMLEKKC